MFCNQFVISLIKSETQSFKRKYIDVHCHYILYVVKRSEVKVNFISLTDMAADLMTKRLSQPKLSNLIVNMHNSKNSGDA